MSKSEIFWGIVAILLTLLIIPAFILYVDFLNWWGCYLDFNWYFCNSV